MKHRSESDSGNRPGVPGWLAPLDSEATFSDQRARAWFASALAIALSAVSAVVLLLALLDDRRQVAGVALISMLLSIGNLLFLRARKLPVQSAHVSILLAYVLVVIANLSSRGLANPSLAGFYVLTVAALLALGRRAGWIWIAVILLTLGVFGFFRDGTAGESEGLYLLQRVLVVSLLGGLVTLSLTFQRRLERRTEVEVAELGQRSPTSLSDYSKAELLARVSQEIRTPMSGVIGMTDLLLKADLPSAQRHQVEAINSSAETLLSRINDVLDLSKIEGGRLSLYVRSFRLREMLENTLALLATRAEEKGLELKLTVADDLADGFCGDIQRLRQVLLNLLGNAIKFTREGHVTLRVEKGHRDDDGSWVRFAVQDSGIGISLEDRERLFEPFEPVDSQTPRRAGGSGLGLAISKSLVELMGGEIGVESRPGLGSEVWFLLPLWDPRDASGGQPVDRSLGAGSEDELAGNLAILVVDDDSINRLVAKSQLEELGFDAEAVESGAQALAALEKRHYDAILMDCQMPELDGYETTRRIRQAEGEARRIVVIAVTAHAMRGEREKCLAAGMDGYISKPLRGRELASMLERWFPASVRRTARSEKAPVEQADEPAGKRASLDPGRLEAVRKLGRKTGRDLVAQMIDIYRDEGPQRLEKMRAALSSGDWQELAKIAHSFAGSAVYLGAMSLSSLCRELEAHAEQEDLEECRRCFAAVEEEHQQVLQGLQSVAPTAV